MPGTCLYWRLVNLPSWRYLSKKFKHYLSNLLKVVLLVCFKRIKWECLKLMFVCVSFVRCITCYLMIWVTSISLWIWWKVCWSIYFMHFSEPPITTSMGSIIHYVISTPQGWGFFCLGNRLCMIKPMYTFMSIHLNLGVMIRGWLNFCVNHPNFTYGQIHHHK